MADQQTDPVEAVTPVVPATTPTQTVPAQVELEESRCEKSFAQVRSEQQSRINGPKQNTGQRRVRHGYKIALNGETLWQIAARN